MKKLLLIAAISLASVGHADQIVVSKFGLLNNNNNSVTIDPSQAQDLLNVDVTPGGLSVKKRFGYGSYKTLLSGQALHGGYHFFNSSGNDVQLWGSSTTLYGITNDASPVTLISSATLNSTWDCTDTQQNAYCVNSNRNTFVKTDGATMTWYPAPLGTMIESTPDRVVVAGVSGNQNTLYISQSNTFTNFVVGVNPTDAFNEVIAAPGSRITDIRWGCGKLLWWKDASFGYFDFDDQFTAQVKTVSDIIGTIDNTSAIDPGGRVWFRGQDGHTWMYDCSVLTKQSIDITPDIQTSGKRVANSWTQTTQADWQAGTFLPAANFSTTLSPGDISLSSYSRVETSSGSWVGGSASQVNIGVSSLTLITNNDGSVNDPGFDTASFGTNYVATGNAGIASSYAGGSCTIVPQTGSSFMYVGPNPSIAGNQCNLLLTVQVLDAFSGAILGFQSEPVANSCAWASDSVSAAANIGKRVKFKFNFSHDNCAGTQTIDSATTINSYILGGPLSFYTFCSANAATPQQKACFFDTISGGSSTITSGSYTSQTFDSGLTSSTVQGMPSYVINTSTPYFAIDTSPDNVVFRRILTSSGTNATADRYLRYVSTFNITSVDNALSAVTGVTVIAVSSGGVFLSAVHNNPNFTSWGTLGVNSQNVTHTFYVRGSGAVFTATAASPAWTTVAPGNLISASTGVYTQFRDDFSPTSASSPTILNDVTLNWFEGSASDQAYMLYFDNAIWETVPFGVGQSTNNYIFKYDLINDGWTLYNFGAGGMLVQSNTLYFGDTSSGANIFNFGTVKADNGTAIQSYWKSKDFSGSDPFMQNQLTNIDSFVKKDNGSILTATYVTDTTTSTSYAIALSSSAMVAENRKLLPSGKNGYQFNMKYGDTSTTSQWELFGFRIGYNPQPYRPSNP